METTVLDQIEEKLNVNEGLDAYERLTVMSDKLNVLRFKLENLLKIRNNFDSIWKKHVNHTKFDHKSERDIISYVTENIEDIYNYLSGSMDRNLKSLEDFKNQSLAFVVFDIQNAIQDYQTEMNEIVKKFCHS
jgi:hypothetical protein